MRVAGRPPEGGRQRLFAILINLGLILAVQVFHWPVLK